MNPLTADPTFCLGRAMRLAIAFLLVPTFLAAQGPDSLPRTARLPVSDSALRLPADRASDLLPWLPGGGLTADGTPSWHGSTAEGFDRVTDGIRWASGVRSRGFTGRGAAPIFLEPGLGALEGAGIDILGGGPATLRFRTRPGGDRWTAGGSGESEAPFRADGGMGLTRFEAGVGGPLGGAFRLRAAMDLLGRQGLPGGIGYGDEPYFVPTGIDTMMRYPDSSSLPDSIDAQVVTFGATTKVPFTSRTEAAWTVRADGTLGGFALWGRWIGSRTSERLFSYVDVANPIQARGENTIGHDLAVGASRPIGRAGRLDLALSLQRERAEQGPLTSQAQFDSRDPGLGLMLGGLDLRWTMDNFPIDDELLDNYRSNTPGSRRSPYDLENTAQYQLVDQYRNNPYGVLGWSESGGPIGVLALYEDHRIVATTGLTWALSNGQLRMEGEAVRHDAKYYSHALTSQAFSDVWLEQPTEASFLAEWSGAGPGWRAAIGTRFHTFSTGAARPYLLDTDPSSSTYGKYQYFPRISSYGGGIDSLRRDVEDKAHTAFAPYALIEGTIAEGWAAHALAARSARMPELTTLLAGVNTDLAITNSSYAFGTDLGHEVTDHFAAGLSRRTGPFSADVTFFIDRFQDVILPRLESLYDPARNLNSDIALLEDFQGGKYQGVIVSGGWRVSDRVALEGSYAFTDTADANGSFFPGGPSGAPRRHALVLAARGETPAGGAFGGIGALVSFRRMSGLARTVDPGPVFFPLTGPLRTADIPGWSSLDLRVTKSIPWGTRSLTLYLDGRNLLNAEDLVRAFGSGPAKRSSALEAMTWSNDSAAYAVEAQRNGAYDIGDIDLTFGGAGRGGCGGWVTASGSPNPVNCAYLIAAEGRFGNGDGTFSLTEQHAASMAYYRTALGASRFAGPPRAVRLGLQVAF